MTINRTVGVKNSQEVCDAGIKVTAEIVAGGYVRDQEIIPWSILGLGSAEAVIRDATTRVTMTAFQAWLEGK